MFKRFTWPWSNDERLLAAEHELQIAKAWIDRWKFPNLKLSDCMAIAQSVEKGWVVEVRPGKNGAQVTRRPEERLEIDFAVPIPLSDDKPIILRVLAVRDEDDQVSLAEYPVAPGVLFRGIRFVMYDTPHKDGGNIQ